jgi:hypothetical protein
LNNFAISSGGVGEALQRSASSLFAANNSLDESIALITAANTVVQDPDVVGTALKTVSMRVRGAKTEMEELGLETDGMADSTAKLQSELKALTGVDIMLDKDTFKSTYQIMEELAVKWEDLTDIQQASVTELIAGKRQGNIIASLMTNFDVAQDALQTSMDSAGSATKEHEKWLESLEAKLLQLKAAWQGFAQAFMSSDFLKGALDVLINLLEVLTKLIDTVGVLPTLLGGFALFKGFTDKNLFSDISSGFNNLRVGVKNYNEAIKSGKPTQEQFANLMSSMPQSFAQYTSGLKGAEASMGGYIKSFAGGIAKTAALNIGVGLLQGGLIALASVAISAAIKGLDKLIVSEKELAEQVDKTIGTYKDKHGALMDSKADFDSSNEASLVSRYAELSKGVSSLGTNMSLTTDEYVEYQSVCNDIAALVPSLVSGYDEQGNAILSCAGNVNELIAAYEKLIETQNNKILRDEAADIQKDFQNAMDDAAHTDNSGKKLATETKNKLEEMLNQNMTADEISEYIGSITGKGKTPRKQIIAALEEANIDVFDDDGNKIDLGTFYTTTQADDFIARAINQNGDAVRTIIDSFNADLDAEAEGMKTIAEATLSQAFDISGSKYANMSDTMQTLAKQIVDSFDATYYDTLLKDGVDVEAHINSMLDTFSELEKSGQSAEFEAVFDMQTKFNNGDVSYGEYVAAVQDADKVINNLEGVSGEVKQQLKLGLNTEAIIDDYNALTKKLGNLGISPKVSKDFLKELTAEEYSVAMDVITNWDGKGSIEDIKAAIERQMAIEGLVFDLDIEVEATGIEALNTALAESVSATGLSSDSIDALKARYVDLEQEGYDLSAMFEETSNGIHLNKAALGELEQAYAKQKLDDVDADLKTLKTEYDKLTEEINTCTDASERASLYSQRDAILQQINDCATLASQYKGLASAYNAWQNAEAAGQERDMYENLISGLENIDDEISRGWVDDATIEFLELLTGKELSTAPIEDLKKAYDGLDKKIKDTSYSARDFFTVDDEGNSTNAGVYNFLDAIGQLEEEKFGGANVVDRDDDGNIIGFNFDLVAEKDEKGNIIKNGDQVIAEALGISEELVQIMVRASDDAGFVVNIEGAYTQLADLKSEAESAKDSLIELKEKGIEQLKGIDVEFNLEAEGDELVKEQEKAVKLLDKFRKTDGTIDLEMEGAQDALDIAEFLTIKIDDLTEPKYMQIDASTVDEELKEPLENMQEFERLSKEKHLLQLTGDTEELDKTQEKMDEIAESLEDLDEETKIELGIDGLTSEEIADKLEKGEIEIPANLSIDLEMSEDLKDMRLMMMNQLGIVSDEEVKLKVGYDIDESVVDDLTDEEKEVVLSYAVENEEEFNKLTDEEKEVVVDLVTDESAIEALEEHQVEIEAFARIFGVEEVDDLEEKLYSLNDQQIQILAEVLGQVDVEKLKTAVDNLDDKTVEAIAKALGEGDVEGLKTTINGLDDKTVQAIAEALGCKDVEDLNTTIEGMDGKTVQAIAEALGIKDVDSLRGAINRLKDKDVEAIANVDGKDDVDSLKNAISNLKGKTVTIWASIKKKASNLWDKITGGSDVNGTANVNGTAFADGTTGRAFKQGNWSTKNSGTALMGELGRETIVRDGRFFTVGDTGAGFYQYKKGDIIFNHKQTEELFKNGKVTSGGGRGRALASGTAFVEGLAFDGGSNGVGGIGKVGGKAVEVKADTVNITSKSSGSSKSSSSSKKSSSKKSSEEADEFLETIDWIEIAIDRIERAIDRLDLKANSVYQTWSTRNTALVDEISEVRDEISLQQKAYDRYIKEANSVGLSSSYAEKVRNGKIDIQDITDEDLAEKIKEYQDWYEKALDCKDAIDELRETEAELYKQRFDNVSTQYEGILSIVEHEKNMLEEFISQSEANAQLTSSKYYDALIKNEQTTISELKAEKSDLLSQLNAAVASGTIKENSEAWVEMVNQIDEVTLAMEQSNTQIIEYQQTLQQLSWEVFDILQDKISGVTEETEFLIELLSSDKLYNDNGQLTDSGMATMGQHGVAYNTYMYQADQVANEAARLKKELAKDPFDTELEERYREMISLQQEYILAAQDEKEAIRDMVEEGIELELEALQERIDKYNEALDSQKDLYDYQKKVKEQTEEIASLEKQMSAYSGDVSEETKAKVQELKVSLEEAKADLEETEYDKYISDQQQLLDELYLEYETILNMRLDNIDALLSDMISEINTDASEINATLSEKADSVGYTLSDSMTTIWDANSTKINSVITNYGDKFTSAQTTTNNALSTINTNLQNVIAQLNSIAKTNVKSASTSSAAKSKETSGSKNTSSSTTTTKKSTSSSSSSSSKTIKTGGKINAKGAKIYDYAGDKSGESQYYGKDPIYKVLKTDGNWLQVRYHKLSKGITGWFKKGDVKAYKTGAKKILDNQLAWTQETGREFIVRPSDGAILTPLAKEDSVLKPAASNNIWEMANNPTDFIRNNLDLGVGAVPNSVNIQNEYSQNIENVTFNMPNVHSYNELLSQMQKDKNFERLILSMSVDRLAGGSVLAKNKAIR